MSFAVFLVSFFASTVSARALANGEQTYSELLAHEYRQSLVPDLPLAMGFATTTEETTALLGPRLAGCSVRDLRAVQGDISVTLESSAEHLLRNENLRAFTIYKALGGKGHGGLNRAIARSVSDRRTYVRVTLFFVTETAHLAPEQRKAIVWDSRSDAIVSSIACGASIDVEYEFEAHVEEIRSELEAGFKAWFAAALGGAQTGGSISRSTYDLISRAQINAWARVSGVDGTVAFGAANASPESIQAELKRLVATASPVVLAFKVTPRPNRVLAEELDLALLEQYFEVERQKTTWQQLRDSKSWDLSTGSARVVDQKITELDAISESIRNAAGELTTCRETTGRGCRPREVAFPMNLRVPAKVLAWPMRCRQVIVRAREVTPGKAEAILSCANPLPLEGVIWNAKVKYEATITDPGKGEGRTLFWAAFLGAGDRPDLLTEDRRPKRSGGTTVHLDRSFTVKDPFTLQARLYSDWEEHGTEGVPTIEPGSRFEVEIEPSRPFYVLTTAELDLIARDLKCSRALEVSPGDHSLAFLADRSTCAGLIAPSRLAVLEGR